LYNFGEYDHITFDFIHPNYLTYGHRDYRTQVELKQILMNAWIDFYNNKNNNCRPIGYHGIMNEDGSSNEVRLDSIEKGAKPITYISYSDSEYKRHCREYKEYKDWEKNRNPARYESNLEKNYDSKNVMHCLRLMQMGIELATTGEFNIDRVPMGDREFLLDVRNHKYEYDYLVKLADEKKALMDKLAEECDLPDEIDRNVINELLIEIRHAFEDNK
jgi:hypothetical protein